MDELKKRVGRPTKSAKHGSKVSLGLKVTGHVKKLLDDAAKNSGRTQSQEAELRLERSFERQGLIEEIHNLIDGKGEWKPIRDSLVAFVVSCRDM